MCLSHSETVKEGERTAAGGGGGGGGKSRLVTETSESAKKREKECSDNEKDTHRLRSNGNTVTMGFFFARPVPLS